MTIEEIKVLSKEDLEARIAEIKNEMEVEGADLDALTAEVDAISIRKKELETEERKADIANVIEGVGTKEITQIEIPQEERKMPTLAEVRSSKEYAEAYANYMKTNKDTECRALLTELATEGGQVPVPTFIDELVRTAWEKEGLMALVKKSYMKGIVKVGFELSATGAVIHAEGAKEPDEEQLTIGVIELKPESIKKWITISDELYDLTGESFLRYIYDELTYRIAQKAAEELIDLIDDAPATATDEAVGVPVVEIDQLALDTIAQAMAQLSDEAVNPTIVMNKATFASFRALQLAGNYLTDPFEGCNIVYNSKLPAFADAEDGETYIIVGDFGVGVQANFPAGEDIKIKFDDLSLAEKDLIKIVGRQYVALGLVADKAIVKVAKGSNS